MKKLDKKTLFGLIVTFLALAATVFVLINAGVISMPAKKNSASDEQTAVETIDETELLKQ